MMKHIQFSKHLTADLFWQVIQLVSVRGIMRFILSGQILQVIHFGPELMEGPDWKVLSILKTPVTEDLFSREIQADTAQDQFTMRIYFCSNLTPMETDSGRMCMDRMKMNL